MDVPTVCSQKQNALQLSDQIAKGSDTQSGVVLDMEDDAGDQVRVAGMLVDDQGVDGKQCVCPLLLQEQILTSKVGPEAGLFSIVRS